MFLMNDDHDELNCIDEDDIWFGDMQHWIV